MHSLAGFMVILIYKLCVKWFDVFIHLLAVAVNEYSQSASAACYHKQLMICLDEMRQGQC